MITREDIEAWVHHEYRVNLVIERGAIVALIALAALALAYLCAE